MSKIDDINKKIQAYDDKLYVEHVQGSSLKEGMGGIWGPESTYALYRQGQFMLHKIREFSVGVTPDGVLTWLKQNDNHRGVNTINDVNKHNEAVAKEADNKVQDSFEQAASDIIRNETSFTKLIPKK